MDIGHHNEAMSLEDFVDLVKKTLGNREAPFVFNVEGIKVKIDMKEIEKTLITFTDNYDAEVIIRCTKENAEIIRKNIFNSEAWHVKVSKTPPRIIEVDKRTLLEKWQSKQKQ